MILLSFLCCALLVFLIDVYLSFSMNHVPLNFLIFINSSSLHSDFSVIPSTQSIPSLFCLSAGSFHRCSSSIEYISTINFVFKIMIRSFRLFCLFYALFLYLLKNNKYKHFKSFFREIEIIFHLFVFINSSICTISSDTNSFFIFLFHLVNFAYELLFWNEMASS